MVRKRGDWLVEKITTILEGAEQEFGDDVYRYCKKHWAVKLILPPFGAVILEGGPGEIVADVEDAINEIREKVSSLRCPACGRAVGLDFLEEVEDSGQPQRCRCGANWIGQGLVSLNDPPPVRYGGWEMVRGYLGPNPSLLSEGALVGLRLDEVIHGVHLLDIWGLIVFVVEPGARWKPFGEWSDRAKLRAALEALGFEPCLLDGGGDDEDRWAVVHKGTVDGVPVVVGTGDGNAEDRLWVGIEEGLLALVGRRGPGGDATTEEFNRWDAMVDAFCEYIVCDQPEDRGWVLCDSFCPVWHSTFEGAWCRDLSSLDGDVQAVAGRLVASLRDGLAACRNITEQFIARLGAGEA